MASFEDCSGGVGFILRDFKGQVLMSAFKWFPVLSSPLENEALVIIFGYHLSGEAVFRELEVKSNNLHLILRLQCHSPPLNALSLLVEDILSPSRSFVIISFSHYFRKAKEFTIFYLD